MMMTTTTTNVAIPRAGRTGPLVTIPIVPRRGLAATVLARAIRVRAMILILSVTAWGQAAVRGHQGADRLPTIRKKTKAAGWSADCSGAAKKTTTKTSRLRAAGRARPPDHAPRPRWGDLLLRRAGRKATQQMMRRKDASAGCWAGAAKKRTKIRTIPDAPLRHAAARF
jgi:hypothetical protein